MIQMLKKSVAMENLALARHIFQTFVSMDHFASDRVFFGMAEFDVDPNLTQPVFEFF